MSIEELEAQIAPSPPPTRVPIGIERSLGALAMALLCVITFGNVLARYFTSYSFAFTEEYSIALMVQMALFGSAVAVAANRHVRITFFVERLPQRWQRVAELIAWAATLIMFLVLVGYGFRLAYDEWRFEVTSPSLGLPQWGYTIWLPLLSLVVALRVLGRLWRVFRAR